MLNWQKIRNGVVLCLPWRAPRWKRRATLPSRSSPGYTENDAISETWSEKETIAWGPCTLQLWRCLVKKLARQSFQKRDSAFTEEDEDEEKDDGRS